jgi:radical SAM protein with 4Fe4S-binding SPASM domain
MKDKFKPKESWFSNKLKSVIFSRRFMQSMSWLSKYGNRLFYLLPLSERTKADLRLVKKGLQLWAWSNFKKIDLLYPVLRYFFWEATLRCNLNCRHCGSDCLKATNLEGELSADEIIRVIEEISRYYSPSRVMVGISGGEPLLREDLFVVTKRVADLGFPWGMVTNGYLITPEIVQRCKDTDMKTLTVSIDGPESIHTWLRREQDSFKRAISGVEMFVRADFLQRLQITTIVSPKLLPYLEEWYKFVGELGVGELRLLSIFPRGRAIGNKELFLDEAGYTTLFTFIQAKRKEGKYPLVYYGEEGFLGLEWECEVRDRFHECVAGVRAGGVLSKGQISGCLSLQQNLVEGNIRKDSFIKTWEQGFKLYRNRNWLRRGICEKCHLWKYCMGGGLHLWDFEQKKPKICHMYMHSNSKVSSGFIKSLIDRKFGIYRAC